MKVAMQVNDIDVEVDVEPRRLLIDVLRGDLGLTGTHAGCEYGVCGACTVIVDGRAVRSCLMLAVQADGHCVRTVEGLADGEDLHPVQQAFLDERGLQCGFCTPGFLCTIAAAREQNRHWTMEQVEHELSGTICRCTGYRGIITAAARVLGVDTGDHTAHAEPGTDSEEDS
jgi:carbon-monoxide dehydrogenase small subunit